MAWISGARQRPVLQWCAAAALAVGLVAPGCGKDEENTAHAAGTTESATDDSPADFDTLDLNGDSYLDPDEMAERADAASFEAWDADSEIDRDEIAGNAFDLWDSDGNGSVSESEWERAYFEFHETDDDGRVTEQEWDEGAVTFGSSRG